MQYVFWRWSKNNISNEKTPRKKNDDISMHKNITFYVTCRLCLTGVAGVPANPRVTTNEGI